MRWSPRRDSLWIDNGNRLPPQGADPVYIRIEAAAAALSDTMVYFIPASLRWQSIDGVDSESRPFPLRLSVGDAVRIDLTGYYESPRNLPITYSVRPFAGYPYSRDAEHTMVSTRVEQDHWLVLDGLAAGVVGLGVGGDTDLETVSTIWPRAIYIGEIPCERHEIESSTGKFRIRVEWEEPPEPCVAALVDDAVQWWENALAPNDDVGLRVVFKLGHTALGGPLAWAWSTSDREDELATYGEVGLAAGVFGEWRHPDSEMLYQTVRHELGHVLGIGVSPSWRDRVVDASWDEVLDTHFPGDHAIVAFDSVGGSAYHGARVPVANDKDQGGVGSHWRYGIMSGELMNPYYRSGHPAVVSAVTIGALADLGWAVDVSMAEVFVPCLSCGAAMASEEERGNLVDLSGDIPTNRQRKR
ncbi:leishmanolysin-related zinc metalloendopeptidase [Candidatus Palauibacter sp.]|uniref:leishmanolysin-related zinc metalloendopeptidase n=1 Tax=Candidatus Palauibacter sp. TaxID=3101350 RepID=UPI003CC5F03E